MIRRKLGLVVSFVKVHGVAYGADKIAVVSIKGISQLLIEIVCHFITSELRVYNFKLIKLNICKQVYLVYISLRECRAIVAYGNIIYVLSIMRTFITIIVKTLWNRSFMRVNILK